MTRPQPGPSGPAPYHPSPDYQPITNGLPIPATHVTAREPIAVRARIEWARDGVEIIQTRAVGWTADAVFVEVRDRRSSTTRAWVPASDVVRA